MNYKELLQHKYPECSFVIHDPTDYTTLTWGDSNVCSKPTKEWCDEKIDKLRRIALQQCMSNRQNAYPLITDQLDMLWHMMNDETIPGKGSAWYNAIKDVKDQFPKP